MIWKGGFDADFRYGETPAKCQIHTDRSKEHAIGRAKRVLRSKQEHRESALGGLLQ